ncbi:hypothetical protein TNCV_704031 [Trichonephila clavipes]|nr:hypothetical protein TNCV_704031 [Trichonephila clavipes]
MNGLFNSLLCTAVSTSATFVSTVGALPDCFLSATDPVSRNRCTKHVLSRRHSVLLNLHISVEMHLSQAMRFGSEIKFQDGYSLLLQKNSCTCRCAQLTIADKYFGTDSCYVQNFL